MMEHKEGFDSSKSNLVAYNWSVADLWPGPGPGAAHSSQLLGAKAQNALYGAFVNWEGN